MMSRYRALWLLPATVTIVVLFGGALSGAVRTSLQPAAAGLLGEPSLAAWRAVLSGPEFADALLFTAAITVVATLAAAVLAVVCAALLRRRGAFLQGLFALPVLVPHLVVAVVAVVWLGPGGLADRTLGALPFDVIRDRWGIGIVLVYVYKEVPFLTLLLLAAWDAEVADREEAAAVLGAGRRARARHVVWPAIRMPLTVGALIVAGFTVGSFEVPLVVGPTYPPTLAVLALHQTQAGVVGGQARAAAILLMTAAITLVLAALAVRRLRHADG